MVAGNRIAPGHLNWRQLAVDRIEIPLRESSRSVRFLLAVGSLSLLLAAETLLVGGVWSFERPGWGRLLLALDRNDAQLEDRLGLSYQGVNPAESVKHFHRATELSPYNQFYWADLARTCQGMGDRHCVERATERLVKLCPMVPRYRWQAAQSYFARKELDESVRQFRRALEMDPRYATGAWATLRSVQGPDVVFQETVADSADPSLKVGYVDFLSAQGDHDDAYRIWKLVATDPRPFPFPSAKPYLERLIALGRIGEAAGVWQDLERLGIVKNSAADEKDNLIFNGDFEQPPLNAGFDWRAWPVRYLALDFAASGAYHGAHCLRIDFTVSRNEQYEPVSEIVPVLPHHTYRLQAYVRSEDITSDAGPSLRVSDAGQQPGFQDALSQTTVGTTPWHPVGLTFSTGPKTQAVRLSVRRTRARTFPTEISGTFWLDSVSLHGTDAEVEQAILDRRR